MIRAIGRVLKNAAVIIGTLAVVSLAVRADYTLPLSANFGSVVIGTGSSAVNYAKQIICDFVAPNTNCAGVDSSGRVAVQLPPGAASAANQSSILSAITAPPNCLSAANQNTNTYSAGGNNPANCNVNGAAFVVAAKATVGSMLRCAASATAATATACTGMGAQGGVTKIYVLSGSCFRTDGGTTTAYVTLNDTASTPLVIPVGGGSNKPFSVPLVLAANTGLTFTPSAALSTVFCDFQGYVGA